ncbi:MAG: hypothetical protein SFW67_17905 [Myxococcaceae bacterium]|nr:hypothetical protein [Myxococcaceae bacterium]
MSVRPLPALVLLATAACADVDVVARRARPCPQACTVVDGFPPLFALAVMDERLVFGTFEQGAIVSVKPDGSDLERLTDRARYAFTLSPRRGALVLTAQEPSRLIVLPRDGGSAEEVPLANRPFPSVVTDDEHLVFATYDGLFSVDLATRVERPLLQLDGGVRFVGGHGSMLAFSTVDRVSSLDRSTGVQTPLAEVPEVWGLRFDGDSLGWVEVERGAVVLQRGGVTQRFQTPVATAHAFVRSGQSLFVTGLSAKTVSRVDLVTGEATVVATDEGDTLNIVDTPWGLYWTNAAGQVRRLTP